MQLLIGLSLSFIFFIFCCEVKWQLANFNKKVNIKRKGIIQDTLLILLGIYI